MIEGDSNMIKQFRAVMFSNSYNIPALGSST
jgi:hypothetical protein